jgi:hypothetical protein
MMKPRNAVILKIYLRTIHQNSDMFRSVLIIFRELFNIKEAYMKNMAGLLSSLIFVHKMSVDTCYKLRCSSAELVCRMWRLYRLTDFDNSTHQEGVKFMFWLPSISALSQFCPSIDTKLVDLVSITR